MNYFKAISRRADELNELGNEYLSKLPFISNEKVCERLWKIALKINLSDEENPDWVESTLDGWIPFGSVPRNGSLYFALGYAPAAQDARLRNLLEMAEGRDTQELTFPTVAEKEIVDAYTKEPDDTHSRTSPEPVA